MFHVLMSPSARGIRRRRGKSSEVHGARDLWFERLESRTVLSAGVLPLAGDLAPAGEVVSPPFMAYLKIDDLQGDSQDANHLGWITVLGFSESVSHPGSPITAGLLAGRSVLSDFEIVKAVDKTSPTLFLDAVNGKQLETAVLEIIEPSKAVIDYKLSNATVSSVYNMGDGSTSSPVEQVSFTFSKIEWDFTPVNADGSTGQTVSTSWNLRANNSFQSSSAPVDLAALQLPGGNAPFMAYLKLDGVDGSSQNADHKDWIDVLSYSEGLSRSAFSFGGGSGGGGGEGKVSFSDLTVTTPVDKTTPVLSLDAASGKDFKSSILEVVEPGGAVLDYKLSNAMITAVSDKGSAGDATPVEQISLNFTKIEWDYTPVNADGSAAAPVSTDWDLSAGNSVQPNSTPVSLAAPQPAGTGASFMAYLKLDGVDGSSQDANHKDWIDVLSYSEGLSRSAPSFRGGGGEGKVSFSELTVTTPLDKTAPILSLDAASGKDFKSAILEVVKPGGAVLDYKLSNAMITAVSDKGSAGDSTPIEQVSLNFTKIEWDYTPVNADGSSGTPVSAIWDLNANSSAQPSLAATNLPAVQLPAGNAPFMAYLKLDGVDGSSQNADHKDWIDVLSYSEGVSRTSFSFGGGGGEGKASFSELTVTTPLDKTAPILSVDAASGKDFTTAILEVVEPGGAVLDYKLSNVMITAVSDKGSAGDSTPVEQISLNFTKIEWDYTPVNADGSPGTPVSSIWDLRANDSVQPNLAPVSLAAPEPAGTGASFMAYLKLDGVDGSSQNADHKDWIDVLSYSEGLSRTSFSFGGGGGGEGKVSFSDLTVTTPLDKTTPILFQDAASGKDFKSAVLEVVEPGGAVLDYKLSNVMITAVSDKGSAGDSTPVEQISLNFTKIEWDYTPVNADGSPAAPVSSIWDLRANDSVQPNLTAANLPAVQLPAGNAPFMAYLKLDGVDGASQSASHEGWIDVLSYSTGLSRTASGFGSGGGAGRVSFSDLNVSTLVDKTTPILFLDTASYKEFKSAVLEVDEPNGAVLDYKLSNVVITAISNKGSAGDSAPVEQISLNFTKIEWDYTPAANTTGGTSDQTVSTNWTVDPLPVFGPWAAGSFAGGGTSSGNSAVDTLFGDPKLSWLAYYVPSTQTR